MLMWLLPKQAAITMGTAAKMGYRPQFMTSSTLSDTELMYKITKGLWKGVLFTTFGALPWSNDNEALVKLREAWKKYAPQERLGRVPELGRLLRRAPGGRPQALRRRPELRQTSSRSWKAMKGFQSLGAPVTFGPNQRQGVNRRVHGCLRSFGQG